MKVVISDEKITVYTYSFNEDTDAFVKNILLKLKNKYKIKICGFYQINIYKNSKVVIIDILKELDSYYFSDLVDLKINIVDNSDIYISFDDYFWDAKKKYILFDNRYYINIDDLSDKDFLLATEFGNYEYGKSVNKIKALNNYI